jgi:hypothetical protein
VNVNTESKRSFRAMAQQSPGVLGCRSLEYALIDEETETLIVVPKGGTGSTYCVGRNKSRAFRAHTFPPLFVPLRVPPPRRLSYGLLGPLGRGRARTPCNFGFIRARK